MALEGRLPLQIQKFWSIILFQKSYDFEENWLKLAGSSGHQKGKAYLWRMNIKLYHFFHYFSVWTPAYLLISFPSNLGSSICEGCVYWESLLLLLVVRKWVYCNFCQKNKISLDIFWPFFLHFATLQEWWSFVSNKLWPSGHVFKWTAIVL